MQKFSFERMYYEAYLIYELKENDDNNVHSTFGTICMRVEILISDTIRGMCYFFSE